MSACRLSQCHPRRPVTGFALGVLLAALAAAGWAADAKHILGAMVFESGGTKVETLFAKPSAPPSIVGLPATQGASTWQLHTWDDDHGVWLYANEQGRVRAAAHTGTSSPPQARYANGYLVWKASYIRDTPDHPSFTIIPSWLEVIAEHPILGELRNSQGVQVLPYAKLSFTVQLITEDELSLKFHHTAELSGLANATNPHLDVRLKNVEHTNHFGADGYASLAAEPVFYEACFALPQYPTCVRRKIGARYEMPALTQEMNLDLLVDMGESYVVVYELEVEVGEDGYETYAGAVLGDPLDVNQGGISLDTSHTLISSSVSTCRQAPDPGRFAVNGATATDTRSGLMWQRCPAGYSLNDNGTPTDPADDTCEPGADVELDWEEALLAAEADTTGGHTDWYLPNVKELESLVESACALPALDGVAFPSTPAQSFWTATPDTETGRAWQVSFLNGEIHRGDMTTGAPVRVVRDSGNGPLLPPVAISVLNAQALEGDNGVTDLLVPVELDRPTSGPVTVDFATDPGTASAGDFTAGTGSVTIPAGQIRAEVIVPIQGDTIAEGDEWLTLQLSNPSANAYLARAVGQATIVDDEPEVGVTASLPEQTEGDVGATAYAFTISLDRAALSSVSVDYATRDASAIAGSDYQATSGTVSFMPGEIEAEVTVVVLGDTTPENDERFLLELTNPVGGANVGESVAEALLIDDDGHGGYAALNDTGVTYCANATNTLLACPQTGFPTQDGEVGRDITHANPNDGVDGFSFTKLDDTGTPLPNQDAFYGSDPWACVRDEVTGLHWEVKTDSASDLRYFDWTYSWFDSSGVNDGGDPGVENGGVCIDSSNCDTEKYVAAVNAMNLCGYNDWRLPRIDELFTLARTASPAFEAPYGLDSDYFPHNYNQSGSFIKGYTYWSGTPSAVTTSWAWALQLQIPDPSMTEGHKADNARVRLVRGGN